MAMIRIGGYSSNNLIILPTSSSSIKASGSESKKRPSIFISTNPSHINLTSLSNLYLSCSHSPSRFATATDVDPAKLAVAVSHSSVVVSVFAAIDGGGEREKGVFGRMLPAVAKVTPENGELVGFGRAVSDVGLTAAIYDVMVIPPLRLMGIGRIIVQRILRVLSTRGIYDISALCSEKERLFFEACGFGDDLLGSTTMLYVKAASSNLDSHDISTTVVPKQTRLPYPS